MYIIFYLVGIGLKVLAFYLTVLCHLNMLQTTDLQVQNKQRANKSKQNKKQTNKQTQQ